MNTLDPAEDLLTDRGWAPELFIGADALLSSLKQVHVEAGDALRFLGADLAALGRRSFPDLTPDRIDATSAVSYAVLEESVDSAVFFAFVWGTLHMGGGILASGARILVSSNTWSPEKRKLFSPWRSIDGLVARLVPRRADAQAELLLLVGKALVWDAGNRVRMPDVLAAPPNLGGRRYNPRVDAACIMGSFQAGVGSPTRDWIGRLLVRSPDTALRLATLFARYAQRVGFAPNRPQA